MGKWTRESPRNSRVSDCYASVKTSAEGNGMRLTSFRCSAQFMLDLLAVSDLARLPWIFASRSMYL